MRRCLALVLLCLTAATPLAAAPERPSPSGGRGTATSSATLPATLDHDADRLAVFVAHTGHDGAGLAFVQGFRESLRASSRFTLATSEDRAQLLVIVVSATPAGTIEPVPVPGSAAPGPPPAGSLAGAAAAALASRRSASAVSLAYVANNEWRSLLASGALFVGQDLAEQMGRDTVGELATVLDAYLPTGSR